MEENKDNSGSIQIPQIARIIKAGKMMNAKTCYLCGKHFRNGDSIALIIPPMEIRRNEEYKRVKTNLIMHADEMEDLVHGCSIPDAFNRLEHAKKPKKEKPGEEEKRKIQAFIDAAYKCGFRKTVKNNANGDVACKENGSSNTVFYNVYSDVIEFYNRRKKGLFDGLADRQIEANVYNAFHKILEDGMHDDYDAVKTLSSCLNRAASAIK